MKFISVLFLYFSVFHKFQGDVTFLCKILGYFPQFKQPAQYKFKTFQEFQGVMVTPIHHIETACGSRIVCRINLTCVDSMRTSHLYSLYTCKLQSY